MTASFGRTYFSYYNKILDRKDNQSFYSVCLVLFNFSSSYNKHNETLLNKHIHYGASYVKRETDLIHHRRRRRNNETKNIKTFEIQTFNIPHS